MVSSMLCNTRFMDQSFKFIALSFLLSVYGIVKGNDIALFLVIILFAFAILLTSYSCCIYWSFFMIPNVRLLDEIGVTYIINILMVLPIIKYLYYYTSKKRDFAILSAIVFFIIEFVHIIYFENFEVIFPLISWCLAFVLCIITSTDSKVDINKESIYDAMSAGIIFSSVISMIVNDNSMLFSFIDSGDRFCAFADDPNYFSMYLLYCMAVWVTIKKNVYRFFSFIGVLLIGFLTGSKMELLLCTIIFAFMIYALIKRKEHTTRKAVLAMLAVITILALYKKDVLLGYTEAIILRLGGIGSSIDTITTGRYHLQLYYLNDIVDNIQYYIFGSGFNYFIFLGENTFRGAHNTYIDIIAAWGFLGALVFTIVIYLWFNRFCNSEHIRLCKLSYIEKLPCIIFMLCLFSLSCLSANMFPFMIMASIVSLKKQQC